MENIALLEPWVPVESNGFDTELEREIKPGHSLYRVKAKAIARRLDCDDVLSSEFNSQWPHTRLFADIDDWFENCMKPDNKNW